MFLLPFQFTNKNNFIILLASHWNKGKQRDKVISMLINISSNKRHYFNRISKLMWDFIFLILTLILQITHGYILIDNSQTTDKDISHLWLYI